jgi:trehalose 6-phosphate phosphatase
LAAAVPGPAEAAISTSDSIAIGALASDPARAGLVLDFDGVLAPIVDDPGSSRMLPGAWELLDRVALRLRLLAVLSGRPAAFLRGCVPCDGVELFGSYGLEADLRSSA